MNKTKTTILIGEESFELSLPISKGAAVAQLASAKYNNIGTIITEREDSEDAAALYDEYRSWHELCKAAVSALDLSELNREAEEQLELDRIASENDAMIKAHKEAELKAQEEAEAAKKAEEEAKKAEEERAYYERFVAPKERFEAAKAEKLRIIEEYDKSPAVNGFSINGMDGWLDRDTRTSLMNTVTIEKAAGMETTKLWFGKDSFLMECDTLIGMLGQLEMYAHKCYNVTAQHLAHVAAIGEDEEDPDYDALKKEIEEYDHTAGYPEQLNF